MKYQIKYFPFSAGIPWKYDEDQIIIPKIASEIFQKSTYNKKIILLAHSGLFESWLSLSFFETIYIRDPSLEVYWAGNYNEILDINKLAKPIEISNKLKIKYPVPIFFDKEDCVYFNCLNNYENIISLTADIIKNNEKPAIKQISDNFLITWDAGYLPKIRKQEQSKEFKSWCDLNKFNLEKPFILIVPNKTKLSSHNISCLKWGEQEIKLFSVLLKKYNISLVSMSVDEKSTNYYDGLFYKAPLSIDFIFQLVSKAKAVLSKDIDFLLLTMMISSAKILSEKNDTEMFDLNKNKNYIGATNDIYISEGLIPEEVVEFVRK